MSGGVCAVHSCFQLGQPVLGCTEPLVPAEARGRELARRGGLPAPGPAGGSDGQGQEVKGDLNLGLT